MMPKDQSQFQHLFNQIQHILKSFVLKKDQNRNMKIIQVENIVEQVRTARMTPERILNQIINNRNAEQILKTLMMDKLRETMSSSDIMDLYTRRQAQKKEEYSILNTNSLTLVKQILQNIKLIQRELINLTDNITVFERDYTSMHRIDGQFQQIQLYYLLVVVMEDSEIELSEAANELLFRMYILQQSINLIFHKSNHVFQQLMSESQDECDSERSSHHSDHSTKRSALSESIEIFKQRQRRQQLERFEVARHFPKSNVIKSNYEFCKPNNKQVKQKSSKMGCCFAF